MVYSQELKLCVGSTSPPLALFSCTMAYRVVKEDNVVESNFICNTNNVIRQKLQWFTYESNEAFYMNFVGHIFSVLGLTVTLQ